MRIDENTNYYLYCIYEHGEFHHSCRKLEIKIEDRVKARELMTQFINKYCKAEDNKHPLLTLHPQLTRQLIDLLQQDSKGGKINLYAEAPSVF